MAPGSLQLRFLLTAQPNTAPEGPRAHANFAKTSSYRHLTQLPNAARIFMAAGYTDQQKRS